MMQLSHTPPMSVNQNGRGDMTSDARPSSDEEEGHGGTRNSPFVGPHAVSEPVRSSGLHSRPVQTGPICTTPGTYYNIHVKKESTLHIHTHTFVHTYLLNACPFEAFQ